MRAIYNDFCNVWYGVISPYGPAYTPYIFGVPCRYVPQLEISQGLPGLALTSAWITMPEPQINLPMGFNPSAGTFLTYYHTSDMLEYPAGSGVLFQPYSWERVDNPPQVPYMRYRVALF